MNETTGAGVSETATSSGYDYDEALGRASSLVDFERSTRTPGHSEFHLQRMGLLMRRLGDPHIGVPTIHIAGTNGKGSTAALVASVLTTAGHTTGLYTSPSLHNPTERIRVGLTPVSRETFAALVSDAWSAVEWVGDSGGYGCVSYFELLTAIAFLHFKRIGAAFQVIEVGLGGRLDATNVVEPAVCAITSISLDHTHTLGDTLTRIAGEKAGIIKAGVPVIVAPQTEESMAMLIAVARDKDAPLTRVDRSMSWRQVAAGPESQSFELKGTRGSYRLSMPLIGNHQLENAATAVAAVETLVGQGYDIPDAAIAGGFERVAWPGRLQALSCDGKLVVVDGAHNPDAMKRIVEALQALFTPDRVILVFGALGSHSVAGMASEVAALSPQVIAVLSRDPRALPSAVVAGICRQGGLTVVSESDDVGQATRRAMEIARDGDMVLATGSLSIVAEVMEEITGVVPGLYPDISRPASKTD